VANHLCRFGFRLRGHKLHVFILETEILNGFEDEVVVALANETELLRRNGNEELAVCVVTEARGLEPHIVGVAVDLLLKRVENLQPGIRR
jgi:hypothetical protein